MRHLEVFTGRIGKVNDLVELANDNCVVNFSVAETPRVRKSDGTWEDGTTIWTNMSIFGHEARNFVKSVKPGTFVTIVGYRQAREYTPKDSNEPRVVQQVVVEQAAVSITKFHYIKEIENVNYYKGDGGSGTTQTGGQQSAQQTQQSAPQTTQTASSDPFNSDDPFAISDGDDPFGGDSDNPFGLE